MLLTRAIIRTLGLLVLGAFTLPRSDANGELKHSCKYFYDDPGDSSLIEFAAYRLVKGSLDGGVGFCSKENALGALDRISSELSMLSKRISFCGKATPLKTIAVNLSFFRRLNQVHGSQVTESIAQLIQRSLAKICVEEYQTPSCVDRVGFNSFAMNVPKNKLVGYNEESGSGVNVVYSKKLEVKFFRLVKAHFDDFLSRARRSEIRSQALMRLSVNKLKRLSSEFIFQSGEPSLQVGIGSSYTTAYLLARINRHNPHHKSKILRDLIYWVENRIRLLFSKLTQQDVKVLFQLGSKDGTFAFNPRAVITIRDAKNQKEALELLRAKFPEKDLSSKAGFFYSIYEFANALSSPHYEAAHKNRALFEKIQAKAAWSYKGLKQLQSVLRASESFLPNDLLRKQAFNRELNEGLKKLNGEIDDTLFGDPYKSLRLLSSIRQVGELWGSFKEGASTQQALQPEKAAVVLSLDIREASLLSLPVKNYALSGALRPVTKKVRLQQIENDFLRGSEDLMFRSGAAFFEAQMLVVNELKGLLDTRLEKDSISLGQFSVAPYVTGDDITVVFFLASPENSVEIVEKIGLEIESKIEAIGAVNPGFPQIRSSASVMPIDITSDLPSLSKDITDLALKNQYLLNRLVKPREKPGTQGVSRVFVVGEWRKDSKKNVLSQKRVVVKSISGSTPSQD